MVFVACLGARPGEVEMGGCRGVRGWQGGSLVCLLPGRMIKDQSVACVLLSSMFAMSLM